MEGSNMPARSFLGAAILLVALAASNLADAASTYTLGGITTMHSGPGSQYPVIARIRGGRHINVLGCLPDYSWCKAMMKDMRTLDARLQEQVKAMQAAQGQTKVDAIARVVTTLADQSGRMNQDMMAMHEQMMSHMMSNGGQGSAAMQPCSMMPHTTKEDAQHQH